MEKKRILYFMPDPPTRKNQGNTIHVKQMLEYFQDRSAVLDVDYMAVKEWAWWNAQDTIEFKKNFPDIGLVLANKKMSKKNRLKYIFGYKIPNILHSLNKRYRSGFIDDPTTVQIQRDFNSQLQRKKYDIVIISYVIWARLVDKNPYVKGVKLINDTHDFITAQCKGRKDFALGKTFERELEILSIFDEIWSQSVDEQYLFSQFTSAKNKFVPIMFEERGLNGLVSFAGGQYDIIYVGSSNFNNQKSINWFFSNVYPLLSPKLRICIIGLICNHCPSYPNVEKHLVINDLAAYYQNSKVAICPMLEGTGVKVKVVEAMSFGLPVVCQQRGLDGLPLKAHNGCLSGDTAKDFSGHLNRLLNDADYYFSISAQSKKMFKTYFEKSKVYFQIDEILDISEDRRVAKRRILNQHSSVGLSSIP